MATRHRIFNIFTLIAASSIIAFGCGNLNTKPTETIHAATATTSPTPAPRPTLPGNKIDIGGYNLYIDCKGEGSPTVILESGLEGDVVTWKDVHPEVAKFTRVCRYDRAGLAHSDYGPTPRNAELTAQDLHTLLAKANIAPPYIFVGHSFGGLLIRRYTFDFPDDVTGMIFIDSLQEDWWDEALALLPSDSSNDSARLASFRLYLRDGWRDPSSNYETLDIPAVVEQVRETGNFGDIPITVLTAGRFTVLKPGLPSELETALANLFVEEQSRIAELSSNGTQIIISDTGHNMPRENPQVIINAIKGMFEQLQIQ
jgi:pimeloyl-ACP methyl ester carboxylesterase